jgi:hypothetical protein
VRRYRLALYYVAAKQRLLDTVSQATVTAINTLKQAGCNPSSYYCSAKNDAFYSLLQAEVSRRLTGSLFDFWGNPYRIQTQYMEVATLLTSGPDEKPDTDDDYSISFAITDLDLPAATKGDLGMGTGGHAVGGGFAEDASAPMPPAFAPSPTFANGGGVPPPGAMSLLPLSVAALGLPRPPALAARRAAMSRVCARIFPRLST